MESVSRKLAVFERIPGPRPTLGCTGALECQPKAGTGVYWEWSACWQAGTGHWSFNKKPARRPFFSPKSLQKDSKCAFGAPWEWHHAGRSLIVLPLDQIPLFLTRFWLFSTVTAKHWPALGTGVPLIRWHWGALETGVSAICWHWCELGTGVRASPKVLTTRSHTSRVSPLTGAARTPSIRRCLR